MQTDVDRRASGVLDRKNYSHRWMSSNYYDEWEETAKAYYCNRDPELDEKGKVDKTQTSIHMPDTFSYVRRTVARVTAQPPNIKFHAKDPDVEELISRTLMYQWDKAEIQLQQKPHVQQALLFGWSVRSWYWERNEYVRRKRIDPFDIAQNPETFQHIERSYGDQIQEHFGVRLEAIPPELMGEATKWLMENFGRGNLLRVAYMATSYEGPKCDLIHVGDCFPEPHFSSIQDSESFIVARRRNREWVKKTASWLNKEGYTSEANNMNRLLVDLPNGTNPLQGGTNTETTSFRTRMVEAEGRDRFYQDDKSGIGKDKTALWEIIEEYVPGENARMRWVCEQNMLWIGEIPLPYDLEGKIPFTDLKFIDNLQGGVGDSTVRILRGLQELHSRNACTRADLADALSRPLIGTDDEELYENGDTALKRGKGFRLILLRNGTTSLWTQPEQAAQASIASSLQDESAILRPWMMATGDNNLSMAANVDPRQAATATGSRIAAYNQDILTKDLNDMFNLCSLKPDAQMMYLLNRSELTEPIEFESSRYNRNYSVEQDPYRKMWKTVEPAMFQLDGEIVVETGSTLADDDEVKQQKAMGLMQMFKGAPNVNQDTLRDQVLVAMGEGKNLQKWAVPPQPPPMEPNKASVSLSMKMEDPTTPLELKLAVLKSAKIEIPPELLAALGAAPPPGAPMPSGVPVSPGVPELPPPPPGDIQPQPQGPPPEVPGALAAARGYNPMVPV